MRVLRTDKDLVVFEIEDISILDDGFLDRLPWPDGATKAAFRFENPIEGSAGRALKRLSPRHYPRIGFSARPDELISRVPIDAGSAVQRSASEDLDALRSLTRSTLTAYIDRWGALAQPDLSRQLEEYLEKQLTLAGTVLMEKHGAPAALLNLFDIKDCLGEPAEHIGWAWNDPRLGLEERLQVRALGVDRLKRTRAKSVHAFVDYFNFRSSNSIVRIGFKPACVHVTRASASSSPS